METQTGEKTYKLPAEVSIHNIGTIIEDLNRHLAEMPELPIDGSELRLIDACGLQALLAAAREAASAGKVIYLRESSDYLAHILVITGAKGELMGGRIHHEPYFGCG